MSQKAAAAARAMKRILQPIVRLALSFGLKYPDIDAIIRDLLVSEGRRSIGQADASGLRRRRLSLKGNDFISMSELSVTTGLNRVDIKGRTTSNTASILTTESSYAAKTFAMWLERATEDPALRILPITAPEDAVSFSSLARAATRGNLHYRAVLGELIRLRMADQQGDKVRIHVSSISPSSDEQVELALLADNTCDHLNAAVANVTRQGPPFLERVIFSQGLAERDCIAAMATLRQGWDCAQANILLHLDHAVGGTPGAVASFRIRLGVYAYYETQDAEAPKG